MRLTKGRKLFSLMMITLMTLGCSQEPCNEVLIEEKTNQIMEKLPLLLAADQSKMARIGTKLGEMQNFDEQLTFEQECEVLDDLLDEIKAAID